MPLIIVYCRFGNFRENFIFANSVKRHTCICHVKNPRIWHDLPTSVKDKEFSPFHEGSIFAKPFELTYHKSRLLTWIKNDSIFMYKCGSERLIHYKHFNLYCSDKHTPFARNLSKPQRCKFITERSRTLLY